MSDDFEEELLSLAEQKDGSSEGKKRSKASSGSSKRRNAPPSSDEEQPMDLESGEDEPAKGSNPYKLEGIYKDEKDRARIMAMSELEREDVLATRQAERAKFDEKRQIDDMFRSRQGEPSSSVAGAAKRQHQSTGTSSEKTRKLEELKRKRVEKNDRHSKKSRSGHSPSRRSDDESDSDSSHSDHGRKDGKKREKEAIRREDLQRVRISRGTLAENAFKPYFSELVVGGYVRFMIGLDAEKMSKYRVCEVIGIEPYKTYDFEGIRDDRKLMLKHGKSEKAFTMEQVSNADFTQEEFDHWVNQMRRDKLSLPSVNSVKKKREAFLEISSRKLTDADINAMVARKNSLNRPKATDSRLELNRKRTEHSLAMKRKDYDAAERLAIEIAGMEMTLSVMAPIPDRAESEDTMAKLNEKNRKAQAEAIRKSDADNKEKRRLAAVASGIRNANAATSGTGSPIASSSTDPSSVPDLSLTAGAVKEKKTVEASVVQSLDLDLGDF